MSQSEISASAVQIRCLLIIALVVAGLSACSTDATVSTAAAPTLELIPPTAAATARPNTTSTPTGLATTPTSQPTLAACRDFPNTINIHFNLNAGNQTLENGLVTYLNKGLFPTLEPTWAPTQAAGTTSLGPPNVEIKLRNRQDITGDGIPEAFLTATVDPTDPTDMVGIQTYYLILRCADGQYVPIFVDYYQEIYEHYQVDVLPDDNGTRVPDVRIMDTYTHFIIITKTRLLRWDGQQLQVLSETDQTPLPVPSPLS